MIMIEYRPSCKVRSVCLEDCISYDYRTTNGVPRTVKDQRIVERIVDFFSFSQFEGLNHILVER